jgi:hypothetical protein
LSEAVFVSDAASATPASFVGESSVALPGLAASLSASVRSELGVEGVDFATSAPGDELQLTLQRATAPTSSCPKPKALASRIAWSLKETAPGCNDIRARRRA